MHGMKTFLVARLADGPCKEDLWDRRTHKNATLVGKPLHHFLVSSDSPKGVEKKEHENRTQKRPWLACGGKFYPPH